LFSLVDFGTNKVVTNASGKSVSFRKGRLFLTL